MASIFKILAASVGGGIVLGAGIRLGQTIATQIPAPGGEVDNKLAERLDDLENRLSALTPHLEAAASASAGQVRDELRGWIEQTVTARMTEVGTRLEAETVRGQKEVLDAFASGVETRVIHRISRLEEEVASHAAAVHELRESSLRTETSFQKVLGGLDKLLVKKAPEEASPAAAPAPSAPIAAPVPPPASFTVPEKRRWKLFG
jgi:hypothetical protein